MRSIVCFFALCFAGAAVVLANSSGTPAVAPGVSQCPDTNPPKTLIIVLGPTTAGADSGPGGPITNGAAARAAQHAEEGYSPQTKQFPDMDAALAWIEARAAKAGPPDCLCRFRHVEFYGHGAAAGPVNDFAGNQTTIAMKWCKFGCALRKIMTHKPGQRGHIVLGWCNAGDTADADGLPEGKRPGGIIAGYSGIPVYGAHTCILFLSPRDHDNDPNTPPVAWPFGTPHSQPHPDKPSQDEPDGGGWGRFPPKVPFPDDNEDGQPDAPGTTPNGGWTDPEKLKPGDLDKGGSGKLPRHPADPVKPGVPLVDGEGEPLKHPETDAPLVDDEGEPLVGPKGPHGEPLEDPKSPHNPLTGDPKDPHEGRPFGTNGQPPTPTAEKPPSPDKEPHVPPTEPDPPSDDNEEDD